MGEMKRPICSKCKQPIRECTNDPNHPTGWIHEEGCDFEKMIRLDCIGRARPAMTTDRFTKAQREKAVDALVKRFPSRCVSSDSIPLQCELTEALELLREWRKARLSDVLDLQAKTVKLLEAHDGD